MHAHKRDGNRNLAVAAIVLLLAAGGTAGPLDQGSMCPGGGLNVSGDWDIAGKQVYVSASISPGLEYAIGRGIFVGGSGSLAGGLSRDYYASQIGTYRYAAFGIGPVARIFLTTDAPCWFIRFEPSGSIATSSGVSTGVGVCAAGSVAMVVMLGHGVALEPALLAQWTSVRTDYLGGQGHGTVHYLHGGGGVGLRSYI